MVDVSGTVTDNDELGLIVSPRFLNLTEGGTSGYTVQLTAQPVGATTVQATVSTTGGFTITAPASCHIRFKRMEPIKDD